MRGILVSILLLLATPAFAQFTSNVQGTITDSSGAVAVGATITLTNTDTNATQVFTTSKSGQYFFNRLAPGSYRVSAHLPGFKESVRVAQLTTEQTAGIDLQLSVGATTESVTVSAEDSHGINADETRLQYTLSAREISEMPLQNQATLGLLRAAPGATGVSENHLNVNVNQDQGSESANGRTNNSNLFVLDSIPIVSELAPVGGSGGAVDFVPHTDMIQEIALQTTTFSVENGASSGIQTSITTKSGGNRFHGDADYNYSGRPLEATPHPLTSAPPYRSQQVSGALGGPIWKDHTFFFGSYFNQQFAQVNSQNVEFVDPMSVAFAKTAFPVDTVLKGLVPVEATLRADLAHSKPTASGNLFAGLGGGDWIDNGACAAGSGVTPLVPCQIPVLSSSTFNTPQTVNGKQYNFRLDQNIRGGKDHAYISFFRDDQTSVSRRIYQSFDGETPSTGYYVAGNYTRVLSPTLSNQASFGQTRFSFNYTTTPQSTAQLELPTPTVRSSLEPILRPPFSPAGLSISRTGETTYRGSSGDTTFRLASRVPTRTNSSTTIQPTRVPSTKAPSICPRSLPTRRSTNSFSICLQPRLGNLRSPVLKFLALESFVLGSMDKTPGR